MSDQSPPDGPFGSSGPDEAGTAETAFGHAEASPPNAAWSAPLDGSSAPQDWETPTPGAVGWGPPPPQAGWTQLPDGGWSPPPQMQATLISPAATESSPPATSARR